MCADLERFRWLRHAGPTADERDDLEDVTIGNRRFGLAGSSDEALVELDRDVLGFESKVSEPARPPRAARASTCVHHLA